jgi:hypothetical protein
MNKTISEPAVAPYAEGRRVSDWAGLGRRGGAAKLRLLLASARGVLAIAGLSMLDYMRAMQPVAEDAKTAAALPPKTTPASGARSGARAM